jgi:hypothetical protein
MQKLVMDRYREWETKGDNHQAGAIVTNTMIAIEKLLPHRMQTTAETGCGKSTILFSNISDRHLVFTTDDRDKGKDSSILFFQRCPLTQLSNIELNLGPTQRTLPQYEHKDCYDLVLIDGPHGYPFPELEYYYFYPHIKEGGILIVDDVHIPTIARMADFINDDAMFELVKVIETTAIFRRTGAQTFDPEGDGWWQQRYNRRRVSALSEIYLDDGILRDTFFENRTSAHRGNPLRRVSSYLNRKWRG